jgi:RNA polymerase sigma-70 factor (ECF subfamily)
MNMREELERLHTASFGWAMACCGHRRPEAEDVLQSAYLKILDGRARYAASASFRTWLFSVIRNTALEARRRGWLRDTLLARWHREMASEHTGPGADATVAQIESLRRIRAAIGALSQRQQEVLHLVFYQDLTVEEAAQILSLSVGSARTHFERGKARLRGLLAGHGTV